MEKQLFAGKPGGKKDGQTRRQKTARGNRQSGTAAAKPAADYEKELEERIAQILKSVEGVGKVDVMVVLSSSGEKVYRTDRSENTSTTKEKDASGGERDIASSQSEENTILSQQSGSTGTSPRSRRNYIRRYPASSSAPRAGIPHCAGRNFPGYGSIIRVGTA